MNKNEVRANFGDANIAAIEALMEKEKNDTSRDKRAYTMLQNNSPCEVTVTDSSMIRCARALLK